MKEIGVNIGIYALYKQVGREYTKLVNEVPCDVVVEMMAYWKSWISLLVHCKMKIILERMMIVLNLQRNAVGQKVPPMKRSMMAEKI